MRSEVTAALLHSPQLPVLDEPTVGLDLISKERLRVFLARANAVDGVTLLLTTHDLPDVERLCRRLVVIDHGRLVVDLEQPQAALDGLPGVLEVTVKANGLRQELAFSAEQTSAAQLIAAVVARVAVRDLFVVEPSIEDVVRTLYTG